MSTQPFHVLRAAQYLGVESESGAVHEVHAVHLSHVNASLLVAVGDIDRSLEIVCRYTRREREVVAGAGGHECHPGVSPTGHDATRHVPPCAIAA